MTVTSAAQTKDKHMSKMVNIAFVLLIFAQPSFAGELEDRASYNALFSKLFLQEEFAELDRRAIEYRTTESRSGSGLWMLTHLYAGIRRPQDESKDENYWSDMESKALKWIALRPESPTPHNVYAGLLLGHGWKFRGGGWAGEVKKENWKPFYEYVKKAKDHLLKHKQVASTDPRWYELMINVARDEGWERQQFDELLTEAVLRHPYFHQIYFATTGYLAPKWHGSKEEIEKFANFVVEQTKAKEGMGMYARIYWYVSQIYSDAVLLHFDIDWERMKRGMDDVLASYPDQWNINHFAFFACINGDKQKTVQLFRELKAPVFEAWMNWELNRWENYYDRCKSWTSSLARLVHTDTELKERLVGKWKEMRLLENEGKAHQYDISLKNDGSFELIGIQYYIKQRSSTKFTWRGSWGVKDGMFWYTTAFSDQPRLFPPGDRLEDQIISVSNDEWVMLKQNTGNKSRARRVRD